MTGQPLANSRPIGLSTAGTSADLGLHVVLSALLADS